jgi:excisionase family DNA binding protein
MPKKKKKERTDKKVLEKFAEPHYVTVAQVASRWQVSERFVRNLVQEGALQGIKIGRTIRIIPESVHDYIEISCRWAHE